MAMVFEPTMENIDVNDIAIELQTTDVNITRMCSQVTSVNDSEIKKTPSYWFVMISHRRIYKDVSSLPNGSRNAKKIEIIGNICHSKIFVNPIPITMNKSIFMLGIIKMKTILDWDI